MEALPLELMLNILQRVHYQTLRAVVHASPDYHAVYRSFRHDILTSATLKHLDQIGFNLSPPSRWLKTETAPGFLDYYHVEICFTKPDPPPELLAAAFDSYFTHLGGSEGNGGPLRLLAEYCAALLSIKDVLAGEVKAGEVKCSREAKVGHDHFTMYPLRIFQITDVGGVRSLNTECWCWIYRRLGNEGVGQHEREQRSQELGLTCKAQFYSRSRKIAGYGSI